MIEIPRLIRLAPDLRKRCRVHDVMSEGKPHPSEVRPESPVFPENPYGGR